MAGKAGIGKRALQAFWCGYSIAVHHPNVGVLIRHFDWLPSEVCTDLDIAAYTKMPHARFWRYFWQGYREGEKVREGNA